MTIYCASTSCGMKNEYTGGIRPNFCQYCGEPFSKAFAPKKVEASQGTSSRPVNDVSKEELSFEISAVSDGESAFGSKTTVAALRKGDANLSRPNLEPEINGIRKEALKNMIPDTPPAPVKTTRKSRKVSR